jgi:hypothetical protein
MESLISQGRISHCLRAHSFGFAYEVIVLRGPGTLPGVHMLLSYITYSVYMPDF